MNAPIHKSEIRQGVTVYQMADHKDENAYAMRGTLSPYSASQPEQEPFSLWSAVIALATSLLMLGWAWMMVHYWNMLTG